MYTKTTEYGGRCGFRSMQADRLYALTSGPKILSLQSCSSASAVRARFRGLIAPGDGERYSWDFLVLLCLLEALDMRVSCI